MLIENEPDTKRGRHKFGSKFFQSDHSKLHMTTWLGIPFWVASPLPSSLCKFLWDFLKMLNPK